MKRIICLLCAAALLAAVAVPAAASDAADAHTVITINLQSDQPVQHWRITMAATVVANTGDNLVVSLNTPDNMATEEGDLVDPLQSLPIVPATTFADGAGGEIAADAVLPGQEVLVTFRYHWQDSSPRMPQMDRCLAVELTGERRTAASTAAVDDFARDQLVGTVLSVSGRQMEVYVESGRVCYGSTEYLVQGRQRLSVPAGATVLDADGRSIQLSAVKPFQRVVLSASNYMWAESMPPQLALQESDSLRLLADGEKIFPPAVLAAQNRVTATVLSVAQTENGAVYTVQPQEGSRERGLAESFTVAAPISAAFDEEQQAALSALRAGSVVTIHYAGLVYGEGTQSRIDWAHSIQLVQA